MLKSTAITLTVFFMFLFSFCNEKEPDSPAISKEWTTVYSEEDWRKDSINYTKLTGDTVNIDSFLIKFLTTNKLVWSTWYGPE